MSLAMIICSVAHDLIGSRTLVMLFLASAQWSRLGNRRHSAQNVRIQGWRKGIFQPERCRSDY